MLQSSPRLAVLPSRQSGSSPLVGPGRILSQQPIPGDPTYTELDQRVGLALFDAEYRRITLARVMESLTAEQEQATPARALVGAAPALAS